jgi:GT2 family glycosyltransferase
MEQATEQVKNNGSNSAHPLVTIGIVNYNGRSLLEKCLVSVYKNKYPSFRVMVVDNASTDDSVTFVRDKYKDVAIHQMESNRGPNPARNYALKNAESRYVLLLDNDAILTEDCLLTLMAAIELDETAATCSPVIVDEQDSARIQYGITHIHYAGAAILKKSTDSYAYPGTRVAVSTTINGTALLVDRERANPVSLFDEDMFFGWTDGDYSFRLSAAGLKCLVNFDSVVRHPSSNRSAKIIFHQVKNRWLFILKNYSGRTIAVLLPALLFYESAQFGFMILSRSVKDYFSALAAIAGNWSGIRRSRRATLANKKVSDRILLCAGDFMGAQIMIKNKLIKSCILLVNVILDKYWLLARKLI